jgi:hypothetical protein
MEVHECKRLITTVMLCLHPRRRSEVAGSSVQGVEIGANRVTIPSKFPPLAAKGRYGKNSLISPTELSRATPQELCVPPLNT